MYKISRNGQKSRKYTQGWTTLEYIIGALIILGAVVIAVQNISKSISSSAGRVVETIDKAGK